MAAIAPTVLALDFDGVLCDGLKEYFVTSWRAYCDLWQPADLTPPAGAAEQFYRLRPVVETGWEMPILVQAILLGIPETEVLQNWLTLAPDLTAKEGFTPAQLVAAVDGTRDRWIATDPDTWLAEHRFYPGVIEKLGATMHSATHPIIISTKEKRFIEELLRRQGLEITNLRIYGKEVKRPKHQVLRELIAEYGAEAAFWFVEDRFKTLQGILKQPDLTEVKLFLADWGYNTAAERSEAAEAPDITLITLEQFSQDFAAWLT
jgi:phosphoglycolate phosphatase-like HAD superfamily hydrolase